MAGSARRAGRALGGTLAALLTLSLVAALGYSLTHLEQLSETVAQYKANSPAGQSQQQRLSSAADSAIGYAEELGAVPDSGGGTGTYAFSHPGSAGDPVRAAHWCPGTIGYRIDATAARAAGSTLAKERARWQDALGQWSAAAQGRYRFRYLGEARYPIDATAPGSFPVAPGSVPPGEIAITYGVAPGTPGARWDGYRHPALGDGLGIAGVGPVAWDSGPDRGRITTAMIVLDGLDAEADPRSVPVQYVHEAGHALGLSHVSDPTQMMDTRAGPDSRINRGDIAGLRILLRQPCSG